MNYSELSIKELKVIAADLDCTLQGDKRKKQSWIDAIEVAQAIATLGEPETETEFDAISSEYMGLSEVLSEIVCGNDDDTNVDDSNEPDGSDPDSGDIFGGFGDEAQQEIIEPKPQPPRGASTVALVIILAFGLAFLVVKMGFTSIVWVITALIPFALEVWRYLFPASKHQDSIDYFPLPTGNIEHSLSVSIRI